MSTSWFAEVARFPCVFLAPAESIPNWIYKLHVAGRVFQPLCKERLVYGYVCNVGCLYIINLEFHCSFVDEYLASQHAENNVATACYVWPAAWWHVLTRHAASDACVRDVLKKSIRRRST